MKPLVVYYSRTGNTKNIAQKIRNKLNADLEEIIDMRKRKGFIGFLTGGFDAARKRKTKIQNLQRDVSKYDIIIVGTPIWAGTCAPAIRTFLSTYKVKKVAFFSTRGSKNPQKTFSDMESLVGSKPTAVLSLQEKEVNLENDERINKFIAEINSS